MFPKNLLKLANGQLCVIAMEIAFAEFLRENQVIQITWILVHSSRSCILMQIKLKAVSVIEIKPEITVQCPQETSEERSIKRIKLNYQNLSCTYYSPKDEK